MSRISDAVARCEANAGRNHGVITRTSALATGVPERKVSRLVQEGRWRRVLPGAYVPVAVPMTRRTRLIAVHEWAGTDCVFSHRTAGVLLQLEGIAHEDLIEITLPRSAAAPGVTVHRLREGQNIRTVFADGVTNVDRTLLDLFSVLPAVTAELALEDALRKRLTTLDRLWDAARSISKTGRNGTRSFRKALLVRDHRDGTLQSRMETRLLKILRRAPDPPVVAQHKVIVGDESFRLDFAFPEVKLGIEAQGLKWHLGEVRWKHDMRRDRKLKTQGWTLLYYPWDDIDLRPNEVLNEITGVREQLAVRLF